MPIMHVVNAALVIVIWGGIALAIARMLRRHN
jgi:hypothetical protein